MRGKRSGSNAALRSGSFTPSRTGPDGPQGNSRASSDSGPRATCSSNEVLLKRSAPDQFFLRIADITIGLVSDDPALRVEVDETTEKFLVDGSDQDITVKASWGDLTGETEGQEVFNSGALWQLFSKDLSFYFQFTSSALGPLPYKIAQINQDFTQGEVVLQRSYFTPDRPLYPLEYPLDEIMMMNYLTRGKGAEIHASGIVDEEGEGHLFVGQSGAGKTTLSRLWQNAAGVTVLSDDRIILRQIDGKVWMYGTPWHGEAGLASAARAHLKGIYFLRHGTENKGIPISKMEAMARLVACSFIPFYSQKALEFSLEFFDFVTKAVPCSELRFTPDEGIVRFIMQAGCRRQGTNHKD